MFKVGDIIQYKHCHSIPPKKILSEDLERCVYVVSEGRFGSSEISFSDAYRYEILKFPKIYEYLDDTFPLHSSIDVTIYDAANRLLKYFERNAEFTKFNHSENSDQDVKTLFEEMVDKWIEENYLNVPETSDDSNLAWMEKYNILTDSETNAVIKDELFSILRKK